MLQISTMFWFSSESDCSLDWISAEAKCFSAIRPCRIRSRINKRRINHTHAVSYPPPLSLSFLSAYFSCLAHPLKCFLSSFHFFLHNNNSVIEIGCITHCVMHYCMYVLCNARWYMWLYCLAFRSLCVSSNALASATLRASSSDVFRLLMSLTHAN